MKITDYALVFVGITFPFILIAYINIALTIRTYQQEMYYQKMIDAAVEDTMNQMKFVESDEVTNKYGYSGESDNRLSNNPQIAVDTFFKSIYGSLNILDDKNAQSIIQLYVPVIAIMDYNGVYISSIEKDENGNTSHVLKPKRYFSFEYAVDTDGKVFVAKKDGWHECKYDDTEKKWKVLDSVLEIKKDKFYVVHNIEFTTDDRIFDTHNDIFGKDNQIIVNEYYLNDLDYTTSFNKLVQKEYDDLNMVSEEEINEKVNSPLFWGGFVKDDENNEIRKAFIEYLKGVKKEVMTDIITEELSYAANKNNEYARRKGIQYNFAFSLDKNDTMYNDIQNMGVLALVQGIKVGNRYLNYKAYNYSDLEVTHKYYLSNGEKSEETVGETAIMSDSDETKRFGANLKLYHKTDSCLEYLNDEKNMEQLYTFTKEAAAELGYYPCPICNP